MKTIGYVLSAFPVFSETFVVTEMQAMMRRGHRIIPISLSRYSGPMQPDHVGLAHATRHIDDVAVGDALKVIFGLSRSALKGYGFARRQHGIQLRSILWNAMKVAAIAKANKCDHLHAHFAHSAAAHAIVAARLIGARVSFVAHGFDVYGSPSDLSEKLRATDVAVAVCQDMARTFGDLAPAARIAVIHCGIDPKRFKAPAAHAASLRLIFIGRLVEQKGVPDLLKALALLHPDDRVPVDIVGDGPLRQPLEDMSRDLGLSQWVRFMGSMPNKWIADQGSSYAGIVAPFCPAPNGNRDTSSLGVKEAMAMGLPVIATWFMGLKEIVDERCGTLVPINDPPALAYAMKRFSRLDDVERRAMSAAARQRCHEHFTSDHQGNLLSALIEAA